MLRIREGSRVRLRLTGADASHPRSEIRSKLQTVSLIVSGPNTKTKKNNPGKDNILSGYITVSLIVPAKHKKNNPGKDYILSGYFIAVRM